MSETHLVDRTEPADQQESVRGGYRRGAKYRLAAIALATVEAITGCYQQPTLPGEFTRDFVSGGSQHCLAGTDWTSETDSEHHAAQLLTEPGTDVVVVTPFVDNQLVPSETLRVVHSDIGAYMAPADKASVVILTKNGCVFSLFVDIPPPAQP